MKLLTSSLLALVLGSFATGCVVRTHNGGGYQNPGNGARSTPHGNCGHKACK